MHSVNIKLIRFAYVKGSCALLSMVGYVWLSMTANSREKSKHFS